MTTESQSPPATVTREQAVEAAKEHTKLCCDCMEGKAVDYRPCIMARYILQPAPPAEAFDARAFVREVITKMAEISKLKRLGFSTPEFNAIADSFAAELSALIAAQGGTREETV